VIRLREPVVNLAAPAGAVDAEGVERWPVQYDDGVPRNSEALAVQPGSNRVHLVDKQEDAARPAYLWRAPPTLRTDGVNLLTRVARVPVTEATGASFSPRGDRLVVRNYESAFVWEVAGGDVGAALRQPPVVVPLPSQAQGEGVAFRPDGGALVLTSEGVRSQVVEVPLPVAAAGTAAAAGPPPGAQQPASVRPPAGSQPDRRALVVVAGSAAGLVALAGAGIAGRRRRRPRPAPGQRA